MPQLQKANLGVPPNGAGGDDQRTANTRFNANFDVLSACVALGYNILSDSWTLAPSNVGTRFGLNMGAGGKVVKLPLAASVSVNACINFFNVGNAVTIGLQGNDGTEVNILNNGDWATYVSDGSTYWHVAERGRMLWNETVGGDLTVGGSLTVARDETIGGNLTVNGRIFVPEGTAKTPGIAFLNDGAPDTGFFHVSDGVFGVTCNTQEVVRYGPGAVSYTVRPSFGGKVPWDSGNLPAPWNTGNFNPADYAKLTGAKFSSLVSVERAPTTGDISQSGVMVNGLANDARIGLASNGFTAAVQMRCSVNMQLDVVNVDSTQWGKVAASAFNVTSDRRLKKRITALTDDEVEAARRIRCVSYVMRNDRANKERIGVIYQDAKSHAPKASHVIGGGMGGIDYGSIGVLALALSQKQADLVESLRARVDALEAKVSALEAKGTA